jgi:hypothetical protein
MGGTDEAGGRGGVGPDPEPAGEDDGKRVLIGAPCGMRAMSARPFGPGRALC